MENVCISDGLSREAATERTRQTPFAKINLYVRKGKAMIELTAERTYPSAQTLIDASAASRIHAKDASLYNFSENAEKFATDYMGWATLASEPPYPIQDISDFAQTVADHGIKTVILIGQGGSTQAPMTMTKYNKADGNGVTFMTMDSVSPVRVRGILAECDPETTLFIQSSKSGSTIEPALITCAVTDWLTAKLGADQVHNHFMAITDPGSDLQKKAEAEDWVKVFPGEPTVGGRYSALSVFGLVPAALVGLDLNKFMARAREAEERCSSDSPDNPAIILASFLYDNYLDGRDKFSFLSPKRGRVLGLWIEQLVAESVGKEGKGILPNIEIDSITLSSDPGDRSAIIYNTKIDNWDERMNFERSLEFVNCAIPKLTFHVSEVYDLAEHFIMWEYATAMLGYLMKVCPFDQPDVQIAKTEVLNILAEDRNSLFSHHSGVANLNLGAVEVNVSKNLVGSMRRRTLNEALRVLIGSIRPGDFFAINAFLPFTGEGRRDSLSDKYGVASCLEIGPRYLHSTGQLQKGGNNRGVYLILSAEEDRDIPVSDPRAKSLGQLEKAQALGDFTILSDRDRRCVHLHLPDNSAVTLRALAKALRQVVAGR